MKQYSLMKMDEYAQKIYEKPYIFEIKKEPQSLVYIGTEHTRDIHHKQYAIIENAWTEFIRNHNPDKSVVII